MRKKRLLTALCIILSLSMIACENAATRNGNSVNSEDAFNIVDSDTGIQSDPVYVEFAEDTYALNSQYIPYTIVNTTGETLQVVCIPMLEFKKGDQWTPVDCTGLFCGTPDPLAEARAGSILSEWFPGLTAGTYRVSFNMQDYADTPVISGEFTLE